MSESDKPDCFNCIKNDVCIHFLDNMNCGKNKGCKRHSQQVIKQASEQGARNFIEEFEEIGFDEHGMDSEAYLKLKEKYLKERGKR